MSLGCGFLLSLVEFFSAFVWQYKCSYTFVYWDLSVHKIVLVLARRALKLLAHFDSGDKISKRPTVEEQFVVNNFMIIYQRGVCFAVRVHSHFFIYLEKHNTFFSLGITTTKERKWASFRLQPEHMLCTECLRIHTRISSSSFDYLKILDHREWDL